MSKPALLLAAILPALPAAGCGGASLWPFGAPTEEISRKPASSTEYRCDEGKVFYVRTLDPGAVWLIAPDREIRLDRRSDGRFTAGRVELELAADRAELADPPARFANCKRAA